MENGDNQAIYRGVECIFEVYNLADNTGVLYPQSCRVVWKGRILVIIENKMCTSCARKTTELYRIEATCFSHIFHMLDIKLLLYFRHHFADHVVEL